MLVTRMQSVNRQHQGIPIPTRNTCGRCRWVHHSPCFCTRVVWSVLHGATSFLGDEVSDGVDDGHELIRFEVGGATLQHRRHPLQPHSLSGVHMPCPRPQHSTTAREKEKNEGVTACSR